MNENKFEERVKILEGIDISLEGSVISAKGPKGESSKNFTHSLISLIKQGDDIVLISSKKSQRDKKIIKTYQKLITNLFEGVLNGFVYKLKVCSSHFPMSVSIKNNVFEVKNFIGESVPRKLLLKPGPSVKIDGDIITIEGCDKELAGQVAADIEQLMKRPAFDRRIFQDGIYIIEKAGKGL